MSNVKCVVSATSFEKFVEQLKNKASVGYTNVIRATYKDGHFVAALGEAITSSDNGVIEFLNNVDSSTTNVHTINKFLKDIVMGNEKVSGEVAGSGVILPVDVLPAQADVIVEEIVAAVVGESEMPTTTTITPAPKKNQRKNKKGIV